MFCKNIKCYYFSRVEHLEYFVGGVSVACFCKLEVVEIRSNIL